MPARIIEIGSGFSSALMLDVNDKFLGGKVKLTFIEPYPDRLFNLTFQDDDFQLINEMVQDTDIKIFENIEKNDILFIDSSHVSKTGSDVNYIFFKILPILKSGVLIHFHDIFMPFEYPSDYALKYKRSWNEIYLLRSFLMYNKDFQVVMFNTYMEEKYQKWFRENMPLCLDDRGGSIWLKKLKDVIKNLNSMRFDHRSPIPNL